MRNSHFTHSTKRYNPTEVLQNILSKQEQFWIKTPQTLNPLGLNQELNLEYLIEFAPPCYIRKAYHKWYNTYKRRKP